MKTIALNMTDIIESGLGLTTQIATSAINIKNRINAIKSKYFFIFAPLFYCIWISGSRFYFN